MRRRPPFLAALAIAAALAGPARAEAVDPEIRQVITAQIEAFNAGDAVRAESFASPGIRTMFPDPSAFLGMVRSGYGALINPRSTNFDEAVASDKGIVQHVTVVDKDGSVWTAVYTMEKVDGHWTISGCVLVKSQDTTA